MTGVSQYEPVGVCVYCGSDGGLEGLRDEHVVPYSLGGQSILPQSSCRDCERITSAFEGRCARTMYGSLRMREGIQTRRPKDRPKYLPAVAQRNGVDETVLLPEAGVIAMLPLVHFPTAGIFRNPPEKSPSWEGMTLEVRTDAPRDTASWETSSAENFSFVQTFDVDSLARMLAKIAHCNAVGYLGFDSFEHWIPPLILGQDPNIPYLVGAPMPHLTL